MSSVNPSNPSANSSNPPPARPSLFSKFTGLFAKAAPPAPMPKPDNQLIKATVLSHLLSLAPNSEVLSKSLFETRGNLRREIQIDGHNILFIYTYGSLDPISIFDEDNAKVPIDHEFDEYFGIRQAPAPEHPSAPAIASTADPAPVASSAPQQPADPVRAAPLAPVKPAATPTSTQPLITANEILDKFVDIPSTFDHQQFTFQLRDGKAPVTFKLVTKTNILTKSEYKDVEIDSGDIRINPLRMDMLKAAFIRACYADGATLYHNAIEQITQFVINKDPRFENITEHFEFKFRNEFPRDARKDEEDIKELTCRLTPTSEGLKMEILQDGEPLHFNPYISWAFSVAMVPFDQAAEQKDFFRYAPSTIVDLNKIKAPLDAFADNRNLEFLHAFASLTHKTERIMDTKYEILNNNGDAMQVKVTRTFFFPIGPGPTERLEHVESKVISVPTFTPLGQKLLQVYNSRA